MEKIKRKMKIETERKRQKGGNKKNEKIKINTGKETR